VFQGVIQVITSVFDPPGTRVTRETSTCPFSEFIRGYWKERQRAARRVFNDPAEVQAIVTLLKAAAQE